MTMQEKQKLIITELKGKLVSILAPVIGPEFTLRPDVYVNSDMGALARVDVQHIAKSRGSFSVNWDSHRCGDCNRLQIWNLNPWNGAIAEYPEVTAAYRAALRVVDNLDALTAAFEAIDFTALENLEREEEEERKRVAAEEEAKLAAKMALTIESIKPGDVYACLVGCWTEDVVTIKQVTRTRVFFKEGAPWTVMAVKAFATMIMQGTMSKRQIIK